MSQANNFAGMIGIEREMLRIESKTGNVSKKAHPSSLGDSLYHRQITTDFSEAQIEIVVKHNSSIRKLFQDYEQTMAFVHTKLADIDQCLWPYSMPPRLATDDDEIQLAIYGNETEAGRNQEIYRLGLKHRYGPRMQCISGIHLNFSIDRKIVDLWQSKTKGKQKISHLKNMRKGNDVEAANEIYLAMIRNFFRHSHYLTFLFGASPCFDKSFLQGNYNKKTGKQFPKKMIKEYQENTIYYPYATALRQTQIGYLPLSQWNLPVSYNSVTEYSESMKKILASTHPEYQSFPAGQQLNPYILQSENEHYMEIRPKQDKLFLANRKKSLLDVFLDQGIGYVEIRSLDIDPNHYGGITIETIAFMQIMFYYCIFQESPKLETNEMQLLLKNHLSVAWDGRNPELQQDHRVYDGEKFSLSGIKLCQAMQPIAELLNLYDGSEMYTEILGKQKIKFSSYSGLPSEIMMSNLRKFDSYMTMGLLRANLEQEFYLKNHQQSELMFSYLEEETKRSILKREKYIL